MRVKFSEFTVHATETKETIVSNERSIVENPNWQKADQLPI